MIGRRALLLAALLLFVTAALAQRTDVSLAHLTEGQTIGGFRTTALYLNDSDEPMGARFSHTRTGFTLDYLRIQSVPQAVIWVNSFPTSDMGEPHTLEHLLLGKGNKGRALQNLQSMSLSVSRATTMQWRTRYFFCAMAGPEAFYRELDKRMDGMLHPDYSDEEVRREVRNFGVTENPRDKSLRLEEKGTVYNEMVTYMDQAGELLGRALGIALYGPEHPLSYTAGGTPEGLRKIRPDDIHRFHDDNYHLANMGMVASFPKEMALATLLPRLDAILRGLEPEAPRRSFRAEDTLPPPQPAPPGQIQIVDYPNKDEQQSGSIILAWPATLQLDGTEKALLQLFLKNVAGGPGTNLYKKFVDSRTHEMDLGAKSVYARVSHDRGHPVMVGFGDVARAHINEREIAEVRGKVMQELASIAAYKDGSPELTEFNARLRSRLIDVRRWYSKFVNSPPDFASSEWMTHLYELNEAPGFRKSVTMKPQMAAIETMIAGDGNIWRKCVAKWKLAEVGPYAVGSRANPELIRRAEQERGTRIKAETERLKAKYGVSDDQEALRRYRSEYDATSLQMEKVADSVKLPRFVDNPPLTLDDQLEYQTVTLPGGIPMVASTFDGITSAAVGLALRLDGVPERQLVYLSVLPSLLTGAGVIKDGKPISYEDMADRLRNEILDLDATFSLGYRTGRAEIVIRGSGNDAAESQKAIEWMKAVLFHPDWRPENLPRIRDQVDQLTSLRLTTEWSPQANAYRRQDNPLLFSLASFMTRVHNVYRLRWMLKDSGNEESRAAISAFLADLAGAQGTRAELKALLAALGTSNGAAVPAPLEKYTAGFQRLPLPAKSLAADLAKDLDQILPDIPDSSLSADWDRLCREMRRDLLVSPQKTLAELDSLRQSLLNTGNARMFLISSKETRQKLIPAVHGLVAGLEKAPAAKAGYRPGRIVDERLRARDPSAIHPVFVALLNPNSQGGTFVNSAPCAFYGDTDREKLLDYLAANLYSGRGGHGVYMKTWSAGLAYSNGFAPSAAMGRLQYYADRTPELPQTLRFVINDLNKAQPDPALGDYAIAQAFGVFRAALPYEARGEAMAADLADGLTPEIVSRFRKVLLDLGRRPDLHKELYARMKRVYARVLPGMGVKAAEVEGGVYFVIGPEKQLAAYEQYLKSVEGPDTRLYRLYPRDFWITGE